MHFHGIGLDDNDDRGRPPYPLLKSLQGTELDYLTCWLDHYTLDQNDSHRPNIIGYLKEFKEQQNTNSTTFILPPILVEESFMYKKSKTQKLKNKQPCRPEQAKAKLFY